MNATIFVLFVLMKIDPNFVDFRTAKFDTIEHCEAVRDSFKIKDEDLYKRSFCGTVTRAFSKEELEAYDAPVKDEEEKPAEKKRECHREKGFGQNHPCPEA